MNEFLLGTLWLLYYGLHSFMAAEGTKRFLKSFLGDSFRYYRLFYTLFAAINFGLLFFLQSILPSPELFDTHAATKITAALVFAGGVWVVLGVVRRFAFSFWFVDSAPGALITDGWYAVVRHPMYFGVLCMLAGYFLWFPSVKNLIFVLVSIFYLVVGSLLEEVKLTNQFGEDYRNYRRKVKMLIPGVL